MENNKDTTSSKKSKSWLKRLKQESWEAELLVSTVSIFGTFQLFGLINWATDSFINLLNPNQYLIGYYIVIAGLLAISILVSMFVIHFFLRAYWIGLVGLNSVFPDYSIENSAYSKTYTEKMVSTIPKLKDSIHKVDELCSVIFSAAFTILLIYAYMALFTSLYLLLFNLLSNYIPIYILLIPCAILISGIIVQAILTVFANLKANKEKENLQNWYFKVNKYLSFIIYGPLYKPLLQVSMIFGSNFKKKKSLIKLVILFLISGFFVLIFQIQKTNIFYLIQHQNYFDSSKMYTGYYKTENKENTFLLSPEIESDVIETNILKVFIPVYNYETKIREKFCDVHNSDNTKEKQEIRNERNIYLLACYKQYHHIYIDDKKVEVEFLRTENYSKTNQYGLVCYLKLDNLSSGMHQLKIEKKFEEEAILDWKIPFYYNGNDLIGK